jgi:hypothetical protein
VRERKEIRFEKTYHRQHFSVRIVIPGPSSPDRYNLSFSRYVMFCKIALAIRRLAPLLFCSKKKQYQTHYFLVGGSQLILPRAREEGSNWRPGKQINVADRALDLNITSDHSRTPVSHDISCFYKTSTYLCLSFIPF